MINNISQLNLCSELNLHKLSNRMTAFHTLHIKCGIIVDFVCTVNDLNSDKATGLIFNIKCGTCKDRLLILLARTYGKKV